MNDVVPVTIPMQVECPTDNCTRKFKCDFILGYIASGPYTLKDSDERRYCVLVMGKVRSHLADAGGEIAGRWNVAPSPCSQHPRAAAVHVRAPVPRAALMMVGWRLALKLACHGQRSTGRQHYAGFPSHVPFLSSPMGGRRWPRAASHACSTGVPAIARVTVRGVPVPSHAFTVGSTGSIRSRYR